MFALKISICFKSLKTAATHSYLGVTVGFWKTQLTRPLWGNSTAVYLFPNNLRPGYWGLVCLGSIFRPLLTPFVAVVATELVITPLPHRPLNAKLCPVNKVACLDRFYILASLNFHTSGEGHEGVCWGRKLGACHANCTAVSYWHATELIPTCCILYCMYWEFLCCVS